MSQTSDVTTALTLVIPNEFHDAINTIRSKYDRAYPRWMPHMNFIFPFVPRDKFNDVKERLEVAMSNFPTFSVKLDQLNKFNQKKGNVTFHLATSDQQKLDELFNLIKTTLPEIPVKHSTFTAHMTLGQCKNKDFNTVSTEVKSAIDLNNFTFTVDSICIIARSNDDPFNIVHRIALKSE
jgi:2'-5' RNA ligase